MIFQVLINILCVRLALTTAANTVSDQHVPNLVFELTDDNWDRIKEGEWLIGVFHEYYPESLKLESDWDVFALKCQELNIKAGLIQGHQNPGLQARFWVTTFPKVFYIKDGIVREFEKSNRLSLVEIIKDEKWNSVKIVDFPWNPFSVQMSVFSCLFSHAHKLYNYENHIVEKYVKISNATYILFGFTVVTAGTVIGLVCTCAYGVLKIILFGHPPPKCSPATLQKTSRTNETNSVDDMQKNNTGEISSEKTKNVRKRK